MKHLTLLIIKSIYTVISFPPRARICLIHNIDGDNQDNYPLMRTFSDFNATSQYHVQTICNSIVSEFQFSGTAISFNVTGESGTTGFCRICIPTALMSGTYKVFVNGAEVPYTMLQ